MATTLEERIRELEREQARDRRTIRELETKVERLSAILNQSRQMVEAQ